MVVDSGSKALLYPNLDLSLYFHMAKKQLVKYLLVLDFPPTRALKKYKKFIRNYKKVKGVNLKLILLHDRTKLNKDHVEKKKYFDEILKIDFKSDIKIQEALLPYKHKIVAVICRAESYIPKLAALVPHVPYVKLPTEDSLLWSVDKLKMRRRFKSHNPKITPKFRKVKEVTDAEIEKIEKVLNYPMIVKPFGLAQSLLVTNVYHRDELKTALTQSFQVLDKIYKETDKVGEQGLLVEELLEGSQYSIDTYVTAKGKMYHCPIVHIKTGKQIGFDDYFGYRQMNPTKLKKESIEGARQAAEDAIISLGLRSTTAHTELLRTEDGWKIIEVGPRVGGFREELYEYSYGFDHAINDLRIRMGLKPKILYTVKGYSAALKIYAKTEGQIKSVKGLKKVSELESFVEFLSTPKRSGDKSLFAKNGGRSVVNIFLHNKDRSKLLADIRRLEQTIDIKVEKFR